MKPSIRTVTLGLHVDMHAAERSVERARSFFAAVRGLLEQQQLTARCFRLTCQPLAALFRGQPVCPKRALAFAQYMEQHLGEEIWFCLPGPFYGRPGDDVKHLDVIPDILGNTRRVFTNTLVSSPAGMHRQAVQRAGEIIRVLARLDEHHQANFRFAVMSNVQANTPFFPAAYHQGRAGFSIALELAELVNACFQADSSVHDKLQRLHQAIQATIAPVVALAAQVAAAEHVEFKGIDFSLAPFPGEHTSVVKAIEYLNNTAIGQYDFLFSLYAVNNLLKGGFRRCKQVGFNGTMLSVLEDSWLAQRASSGACSVKDLLLYATVCGCGLDMVPVVLDTPPERIAALIQALSAAAMKWNKPLITRLLPSAVTDQHITSFRHDFIVNTTPMHLESEQFATMLDNRSFYTPVTPYTQVDDNWSAKKVQGNRRSRSIATVAANKTIDRPIRHLGDNL